MNTQNFRDQYPYLNDKATESTQPKTMNDQTLHHEIELSPSHRRALRLRIATAILTAFLVVAGFAGLSEVASQASASVFDAPAAR
jgi:hypothetical protein